MADQKKLPTIEVAWDFDAQNVLMRFDNTQFRSWAMVAQVLSSALDEAKFQLNLQRMAAAQQQAQAMAQDALLRQQLHKNLH